VTKKIVPPVIRLTHSRVCSWERVSWVIMAAVAEAASILVDDFQSTVAPKCFLIHHSPMARLGTLETKIVIIKPVISNLGMSRKLKGSPVAIVIRVSLIVTMVFPWPFRKFPRLRFPRAVYKKLMA